MKKGRKVKLIIMIGTCLISVVYGSWQVWIRIPERIREAETYRAAKEVYDTLVVEAGQLKLEGKTLDDAQQDQYAESEETLSQFKDEKPQPPSKYDAMINLWVWVIGGAVSIPFMLWPFWKFRHGGWVLGEDGTLTSPKGTVYPADQIKGIDMSTWRGLLDPQASNKTTWQAKVILADDQTLVIDDYLWENADKIIARLAHQFHPDTWDGAGELLEGAKAKDVEPNDAESTPSQAETASEK
ncbi:MAG: hypothetical protein CMJ53_00200 [Planctomycetaceae bacterium]|nr:hypothetical protein [Planctomycetaceae bacterium]